MLAPIGFSLGSALCWGVADFSGGLASKQANVYKVVLTAHTTGLVLMVALAWMTGEPMPAMRAMLWGAAAGTAGAVGLAALYRGLAIGKMGIVAPITAVLTATLPVVFGGISQGLPRPMQLGGFLLAFVGIVLISRPEKTDGVPKGIGLALLSGAGFGLFLIFIKLAGTSAVYWPLAAARFPAVILMGLLAVMSKTPSGFVPKVVGLAITAGVLDTAGNACFILATQQGRLDVAAVLSSLYPATTVLLAFVILKERVTAIQNVGVVAALLAVPMIAV